MTSATPKPRAGEHVPQFTQADQWRMAEFQRLRTQITGLQAERNLLREALSVIAGEPRQDDTYAGMDKMQPAQHSPNMGAKRSAEMKEALRLHGTNADRPSAAAVPPEKQP